VFHLALAKVVQVRLPLPVLPQVFSDALREKNVTGVAAIHYSLRYVDSAPSDIRTVVHIGNGTDWTAMNTHAHPKVRTAFQCPGDFQGALHRRIRACRKDQCHAIAGWNPGELAGRFCSAERIGTADNLVQLVQSLSLFVDEQLRVADDVDEQDMRDLELQIGVQFGHKIRELV
jgi:hypothetical protein